MSDAATPARRIRKPVLRRTLNGLFLCYDACYRLLHRLYAVDDFLYLKIKPYRGEARIFADRTVLREGDLVAVIHFNNRYLQRVHAEGAKGGRRAAFVFGYALIRSMHKLALEMESNPSLQGINMISGITWFRPHGNGVGFESEPLPDGGRKRLLKSHFRLLLYAMFPQQASRENARLEPHRFWLTRNRLLASINPENNHVAQRFSRHNQPRIAG